MSYEITDITQANNFNIRAFDLNFTAGSPFEVLEAIVNFANDNREEYGTRTRIVIQTAPSFLYPSGYIMNTGMINEEVNADHITDRLTLDYNGFNIIDADVTVRFYKVPEGGSGVQISKFLLGKKKSTVLVENDDDLCGQICLMLGLLKNADERRNIRRKTMTKKYYRHLGQVCEYMGYKRLSIYDMQKFADNNPEYNVQVIGEFYDIVWETTNEDADKIIYLFYDAKIGHYHLITNVEAFMNDKSGHYKYCFDCKKRMYYTTFKNHCCDALKCKLCHQKFDNKIEFNYHMQKSGTSDNCPHCNLRCRGDKCLELHVNGNGRKKGCDGKDWFYDCCFNKAIKQGMPTNKAVQYAWGRSCDKDIHKCDHKWCRHCQDYLHREHRCFIQPKELKDKGLVNLVAFDFESWIESDGGHTPMFIVADGRLMDKPVIWTGENSLAEFVEWCMGHTNTTFIAHNGKAYDTWLIHHYVRRNNLKPPEKIILAGQKIMYMKFDSNCFIDSLNHFTCALEEVPKTFGLNESEFKKGFYPYTFNTRANWDYVGVMPDIKYFNPSGMKPDKLKEFMKWYSIKIFKQNVFGSVWNHKKETEEYCLSDVSILLQGCNVYSKLGLDLTGIDPLSKQTIASWVLDVYLTKFYDYEKYPIAVLKKNEYDFVKAGFHGGRTECIRLHRKWSEKELEQGKGGKYVDIQSLYPTTQFYDYLPYDAPIWVVFDECTPEQCEKLINENFGFFEVDIEMNKELFISPLVNKGNGKLEASVEDKKKVVYFGEELIRAINDGCKVTKIHKLLKFKKTNNLFKDFVSTFLEVKVNASGMPKFWNNLSKRKIFIDYHYKEFGFAPSPGPKNPGLRAIAKLILNSLWGKFGQRPDMIQTKYIGPDNVKEWYKLIQLSDKKLIDIKADELTGCYLFVRYLDNREECNNTLYKTNIAIASAVTANAGMRLYKELSKLGKRVLYHDTDSIIYEYDPELYNVEEGNYLGMWESETGELLLCEYVSIGPKSYSYKIDWIQAECKMKGICLNHDNTKVVNFDTLKHLVNHSDKVLKTNNNLLFKKTNMGISTEIFQKEIKFTMDKRDRDGCWTYPKGYIEKKI